MWLRDKSSAINPKVPLRVGLVVFVSLMFNHSVAADAYVWPGHLHSIQSDPARHKNTMSMREERKQREREEKKRGRRRGQKGTGTGREGAPWGLIRKLSWAGSNYYVLHPLISLMCFLIG